MSLEKAFQSLKLSDKIAVSLEDTSEDYVLDVASQKSSEDDGLLAACCSNKTVRLYKKSNLTSTAIVKGHQETVTGICWGNKDNNVLYTASSDKTIRTWDVRTKMKKEVQKLEGAEDCNNLFTCVDVNAADQVVSAGVEAAKSESAYVLFWDTRSTELLGCYSESHQDDITQVRFHPENPDTLASGSMDGLVCLFDVSQSNEDDAITYALNSCSTVAKIGWCGTKQQNIYCTTHIDTVHVWDSEEGDTILEVTNLKEILQDANSIEYVVDCILCSEENTLSLLAGKHNGDLKIIECSASTEDKPKVVHSFAEGHKSTVRCCQWDSKSQNLLTGGEDAMLCSWKCGKTDFSESQTVKLKTKKEKKRSLPY